MIDFTWLADFVWDYKVWIFWSLVGLFFASLLAIDRSKLEERVTPGLAGLLWLVPVHILFVPWVTFQTWYCYRHPERIGDDPDPLINWGNDMRNFWQPVLLFYACLMAYYLQGWWKYGWNSPRSRTGRLARRIHRLQNAGRHQEARAAYREYLRICQEASPS